MMEQIGCRIANYGVIIDTSFCVIKLDTFAQPYDQT